MGPSLLRTNVLSELKSIQFLELQVHDNLKHKLDVIPDLVCLLHLEDTLPCMEKEKQTESAE